MPLAFCLTPGRLAPGWIDKFLASSGYTGRLSHEPLPADASANLFEPMPGDSGVHGGFDSRSRSGSWQMFTRHTV